MKHVQRVAAKKQDVEFQLTLTLLEKKALQCARTFLGPSFSMRDCMAYEQFTVEQLKTKV